MRPAVFRPGGDGRSVDFQRLVQFSPIERGDPRLDGGVAVLEHAGGVAEHLIDGDPDRSGKVIPLASEQQDRLRPRRLAAGEQQAAVEQEPAGIAGRDLVLRPPERRVFRHEGVDVEDRRLPFRGLRGAGLPRLLHFLGECPKARVGVRGIVARELRQEDVDHLPRPPASIRRAARRRPSAPGAGPAGTGPGKHRLRASESLLDASDDRRLILKPSPRPDQGGDPAAPPPVRTIGVRVHQSSRGSLDPCARIGVHTTMSASLLSPRRYLVGFDPRDLPHHFADVLIIGGGLAGLRAALGMPESLRTLVVTKDEVRESNSAYAQGGIAGVLDPEDRFDDHIADTLAAGKGLCDPEIVAMVVREAPGRIAELISWGTHFDQVNGQVALGLEGGHSHARIVHALGDATGREVMRAVIAEVRRRSDVRIWQNSFTIDLLTHEGRCRGALVWDRTRGPSLVWARAVILATGGAGQLFRETTNPAIATADGQAIAYRAGAELRDMEFMQFHPTVLYLAGSSRHLLTEALRGEGAYLRDRYGRRFMPDLHPLAELAPRDDVSRAITDQMAKTQHPCVYLDLSHLDGEFPPQAISRDRRPVPELRPGYHARPHPRPARCPLLHGRRDRRFARSDDPSPASGPRARSPAPGSTAPTGSRRTASSKGSSSAPGRPRTSRTCSNPKGLGRSKSRRSRSPSRLAAASRSIWPTSAPPSAP